MTFDPRTFRLSKHFVLSDFLGNHSIYTKGYANVFEPVDGDTRLENARCLCEEGLEPLLEEFGPMSISYGFISPEVSDKVVKYQDPRKPSHHLWSLGAAADICIHGWVTQHDMHLEDLFLPDSARGSPIALAHGIDQMDIPYSRMISYSESPYICLALSASEYVSDSPRKMFYENRFTGVAKTKPEYLQYSTKSAKTRAFRMLQEQGLEFDWVGGGYPSYHGGGFRQLQHTRVSKYTMLSDFLFDLKSISNGAKNTPAMNLESVQDAFAAAGTVFDWMVDTLKVKRLSIVAGYVSHTSPYFDPKNDWREETIAFAVSVPEVDGRPTANAAEELTASAPNGVYFTNKNGFIYAEIYVSMVLEEDEGSWHVS